MQKPQISTKSQWIIQQISWRRWLCNPSSRTPIQKRPNYLLKKQYLSTTRFQIQINSRTKFFEKIYLTLQTQCSPRTDRVSHWVTSSTMESPETKRSTLKNHQCQKGLAYYYSIIWNFDQIKHCTRKITSISWSSNQRLYWSLQTGHILPWRR